jgi:hypothetical protein
VATSLGSSLCDSSTVANFKAWAQPISNALASTGGWLQSPDTGQVDWSTISAPPGSAAYVYEIWQPNDGLTTFYLKVEYGNVTGTNSPTVRLTVGTATNGAGTLIGSVVGPFTTNQNTVTTSTTTPYECRFSGAPGRFHAMLWRLMPNNSPQMFSVERSVNSAGAYTSSHVTLITGGGIGTGGGGTTSISQQTLHLALGPAPAQSTPGVTAGGLSARSFNAGASSASGVFNGSVGFETVSPYIGYFDYPLTGVGIGNVSSFSEGTLFATTLYGATRTYIATQSGRLGTCGPYTSPSTLCMRYD